MSKSVVTQETKCSATAANVSAEVATTMDKPIGNAASWFSCPTHTKPNQNSNNLKKKKKEKKEEKKRAQEQNTSLTSHSSFPHNRYNLLAHKEAQKSGSSICCLKARAGTRVSPSYLHCDDRWPRVG
jgi:hypothetical protein